MPTILVRENIPLSGNVPWREAAGWQARLDLTFSPRESGHHALSGTVLRHRHVGPLRIQKPLYPEGLSCCHAVVVHPPGGIACGDHLQIHANVQPQARALVMTPAATKWYGAFEEEAFASQTIELQVDGTLEWLPAENIVFDRARVRSHVDIRVGAQGRLFGWDQLIFGRQASNESFEQGLFDQKVSLYLDDELVWIDRLRLQGSDPLFESNLGLARQGGCATAWAVAPAQAPFEDALLDRLREDLPATAVTRLHPRLLVMRSLGHAIDLRDGLQRLWQWLRVHWLGFPVHVPRLWAT